MPSYEYVAMDKKGNESRGNVVAESASAARRLLRNRNLHATRLRSVSEAAQEQKWELAKIFRGRRRREILDFTRQLGTMIEAEVKITEAMAVLISQNEDQALSQILQNIRDQIMAGESLADSMKQYPDWFDQIYIAMVHIGEVSGNIGRSLKLLADYMSKRQKLEAKIKSALMYPAILVVISILVTIVLMTVVVPKITQIIEKTGRELPMITVVLMKISHVLVGYWWLILLVLIIVGWFLKRALSTPKGRLAFDRFLLNIPVLGELFRQNIVARFTSTLSALIRSGLPVADGLQVVSEITGNQVMARAIRASRERIIAGADIATPLRESKVITPAVAHMISVGERTGELESMLVTIGESIEEKTDISVQRISSVIEPIIIVIMAIVVGFIVVATMLPILKVADISNM
jgi:type II secretory pathway component PulF